MVISFLLRKISLESLIVALSCYLRIKSVTLPREEREAGSCSNSLKEIAQIGLLKPNTNPNSNPNVDALTTRIYLVFCCRYMSVLWVQSRHVFGVCCV